MSAIFRVAIKEAVSQGGEAGVNKAFRDTIMREGVASMSDRQAALTISNALNLSGVANIPKSSFLKEIDEIPEASLEKALAKTAKTSPEQFDDVIRRLHNGDEASQTALRQFYTDNPSLQSRIKVAVGDNAGSFFKGIDELTPAQRKAATKEMAKPHFNKADGGRAWFGKVWDSMTVKNLESATGAAKNIGWLSLTVGVAWTVMSVIGFLTGKDMVEIFSDFFEFVKNPAGVLFDGETGDWTLTSLGKGVFGVVAILGVAAAVKVFKTLTPSEA